jgi:hypothetical protein
VKAEPATANEGVYVAAVGVIMEGEEAKSVVGVVEVG